MNKLILFSPIKKLFYNIVKFTSYNTVLLIQMFAFNLINQSINNIYKTNKKISNFFLFKIFKKFF
jgi:hypothetical protein